MKEKKYYLTEEGFEKAKLDYEKIRKELKKKLKEDAPEVLRSDDVNPDYISFRRELDLLEEKIMKLENVLRNAEVIKNPSEDCKEVRVGAKIIVEESGEESEFFLVGTVEADPALGKISEDSPVGKALLGYKEGDEIFISSNTTSYKIKRVYY
jgi:transcription elongation factor GreA